MPFNPISVSGYHMREAGATAVQEVAFTLANGIEYLDRARAAGLDPSDVAERMSFFFAAHNDLFEEAAKFRAARRLWATIVRERYQGSDAACRLRFHTQTGGSTLTAQQPLNNVVRVAVQALAATLGGTQSLHTNGYDEALALPTEEAATLALRTQQILAHESGIAQTADPLGGSYYVEALTDRIAEEARALLTEVDRGGGAAAAIARGDFQEAIHRSAYWHQRAVEARTTVIVGVNRFTEAELPPRIPAPDYSALAARQVEEVRKVRQRRAEREWRAALDALGAAAHGTDALMPHILAAVRARATVGEISDTLRGVWGVFRPHA
jgi:methylmalonyl-CoA mutase N-terminal domain/subunit